MNNRERMLNGLPYKAYLDELSEERMVTKLKVYEYNSCRPDKKEEMTRIIKSIIGKTGKDIHVEQPFHCDYGSNIEVGENFYSNYNCIMLDVAKITIGNNVMFGPNVSIYTAGHPIHPQSRNSGYEYGIPIRIGDNVWVGGSVVINPGISIGDNVVIGSGSVVTTCIPDNVIAVGNPCRIIRKITEEDRKYYYKNNEFDVDDLSLIHI